MEIIVYGVGERCGRLFEAAKKYDDIQIIGLADSYKKDNQWGISMIKLEECIDKYKDTPIIITMANPLQVLQTYYRLCTLGYKNIFHFLNKAYCWKVDFLQGECVKLEGIGENWLPRLEMHVANHCNLNCKCCTHFSPLFEKEFPDYTQNMSDLNVLRKLVGGTLEFNLLGGEPLLNPQISDYVDGIKKNLSVVNIFVITNGLLIPTLDESILRCFHDNDIVVSISGYEPTYHMIDRIRAKLEAFQVDYVISEYDAKRKFYKIMSLSEASRYPHECVSKLCVNVGNGKIAKCPTLLYLRKLNTQFGLNLPEDGIFQLRNFGDGANLKEKLMEPVPLCKYCIKKEVPWGQCGKEVKLEDFVEMG